MGEDLETRGEDRKRIVNGKDGDGKTASQGLSN